MTRFHLRRRYLILCAIAAAIAAFHLRAVSATEPEAEPPKPRLGINLAGPADWNTELPFVDVFRLSRAWISQRKGAPWGKGPELLLDEVSEFFRWLTVTHSQRWHAHHGGPGGIKMNHPEDFSKKLSTFASHCYQWNCICIT